ncbi:MAG: type IV secretion protein Dot, partial [bacterium]|nr:type IV secretion protein Dot [bacterium]
MPNNLFLNVSGAFDNCFFHAYSAHLIANDLSLPQELFDFKSVAGEGSPASELQKRFPNQESLSLFNQYSTINPDTKKPISPSFIVERTLILGFLMREWFATLMAENPLIKERLQQNALDKFINFKEFRTFVATEDLLTGAEGVLYKANQAFLDYFYNRPIYGVLNNEEQHFEEYFTTSANEQEALINYWQHEGFKNYYLLIASPSTKLAYSDIEPVMVLLKEPYRITDSSSGQLINANEPPTDHERPTLVLRLDALNGHYRLLKTDKTTSLLTEYEVSYAQYLADRAAILSSEG